MINSDRIVPIQTVDLISMYGLVLLQASGNSGLVALTGATDGEFEVASTAGSVLLANEPVQSINFASGYTAGTVYFVADYDYEGFSIDGTAVTPTVPTEGILADARTLYKAILASGAVTITKVGF